MTAALKKAYNKEEPIIVTGWSPHWKFSKFDLKYLEDPKGTYGDEENIHSIARIGLAKDHPSAYKVLDQFNWPEEDMNTVMVQITDGEDHRSCFLQLLTLKLANRVNHQHTPFRPLHRHGIDAHKLFLPVQHYILSVH